MRVVLHDPGLRATGFDHVDRRGAEHGSVRATAPDCTVRCVVTFKPHREHGSGVTRDDAAAGTLADRVEARVREDHAEFVDAVVAAGRITARSWDGETTDSRSAVVEPFQRTLEETGVLDAATVVLADAVDAAGGSLRADPVPNPPYVAVTSRGLVLRATTDVGRVVVTVAPFAVERDPVRYVHRDADPSDLLAVDVHPPAD